MNRSITGVRLELGRVLAQWPPRLRGGSVHFNLSGQKANSLLHDGHAWKEFPRTAPAATRRAIQAANAADATLFVHASFAFVRAVERALPLAAGERGGKPAVDIGLHRRVAREHVGFFQPGERRRDRNRAQLRVQPRLMVCGHIHPAYGRYRLGTTATAGITAVSTQKQRELARAIKRARFLGLLPYLVK